ncbi:MAG: hypothetical protein KJ614_13295 [Gammaproteobacteria bacterium]|nr:hypothetical protein [Gammaproteobacteria bacterium]MBU3996060.1 hypothetical protein [Gammaproteobacteria bacterium]MBU4019142.1 hypothetical protein [Gammaproteobacteria bacterium]MBU4078860.1 hypothetical protein [Gammaproteobacteria bacterium]MBU4114928.1 hypothetical protein [Gammaproteobacteria bacterium]
MAVTLMQVGKLADGNGGGTLEELREQIIAVALDRAFLLGPLPTNELDFKRRIDEGRGRLTLIATEGALLWGVHKFSRFLTNQGQLHNQKVVQAVFFLLRYVSPVLILVVMLKGLKFF